MDKAVAKLRSTPEPGRFYVISTIIEDIKSIKRIESCQRQIIEECFLNVDTAASLSVLVQHVVDLAGQGRISFDDAYGLLLGGLANCTQNVDESCIRAISHGIMDIFHLDWKEVAGRKEQHPLVKALVLEPRTAPTFISRIETYITSGEMGDKDSLTSHQYFVAVETFLIKASLGDLGPHIRSSVVRMSCNIRHMDVNVVVRFFDRLMRSYEESKTLEQEACVLDVLDFVFCPEIGCAGLEDETVEMFLQSTFKLLMNSMERGASIRSLVGAISMFLPTYAQQCMQMTIPLSLQGVRYGETEDSKILFDLILMILRSHTATRQGGLEIIHDTWALAILECACMRAEFYCQGIRVRESVRRCIEEVESIIHHEHMKNELENPYVPCRWDEPWDLFSWIAGVGIMCDAATGTLGDARASTEILIVQILSLLKHPSISVRLQALHLVKLMPRVSEAFSFFALPVLLRRIQACSRKLSIISQGESLFLKDLLFSLSSLSYSGAAIPFIVRTLQPFLDSNAPQSLQGVAYGILSKVWLESGRAFSSLRIALLGCEMEDEIDVRSEKGIWTSQQLQNEKIAVATSLLNICSTDPAKGKDFVHAIQALVCSKYPALASVGLECIRQLCISDVLDFPKAWKVVRRTHPDLPTDDTVAAAWMDLMTCALREDIEKHEGMVRDVMDVSWGAVTHMSAKVRAKGYLALESIDWDVAETLDCLRPPLAYAILLSKEGDDKVALAAYERMMDSILSLEFSDRRKQYIQLSGAISNQIKQSHNARFHKLSQTIPKILLEEVKCGNTILPSSGAGSQVFIILNLWTPASRKASQAPLMYRQAAVELLSKDSMSCFDIVLDLDNIPLLCESWKHFFHRWFASFHPEMAVDPGDYHKHSEDTQEIWNVCFTFPSNTLIANPNIPCAAIAFVLQFGDADPLMTRQCFQWIFSLAKDRLQHPNIRNLSILLIGLIYDKINLHIGESSSTEAMLYMIESSDICMKHRCLALKHCLGHRVPEVLLQKGLDCIVHASGITTPEYIMKKNRGDFSTQSVALGALGAGIHHNVHGFLLPKEILERAKDFFATVKIDDPQQELIPGYCDLFYQASIAAFLEMKASDWDVSTCLDILQDFLKTNTNYKGYVVLAIAKILTSALRNGYSSNVKWNLDVCIAILREHLVHVARYPNIRENAGQVCKGLNVCLEYQMYNEKDQDQSCSEENAAGMLCESYDINDVSGVTVIMNVSIICAENELSHVCTMQASNAVRMGCIPHIAIMCKKVMDFKREEESHSLESFSSSAVGYMSEVLISQSWPNLSGNAARVSRQKTLVLLSCLRRATRLPRKDWTGCLRRCMRLYPEDEEIHAAVVRFVCERAAKGTLDNLREFVTIDMFDLNSRTPIQSTSIEKQAQYLLLANIHVLIRYLSHEECSKLISSLAQLFSQQSCHIQRLAHATCCGLYSLAAECSESMTGIVLDVMVKIMFNSMETSPPLMNLLCSLYPLSNDQLAAHADHDRSGDSIIDIIGIHVDIGALLIAAYRMASPEMQRALCDSTRLFSRHPELHTWLSCALMSSVDIIIATNQSRNSILLQETNAEILSRILAEGFRNALDARERQTMIKEALAWVTTLVGAQHTNEKVSDGPIYTAIMCLAGIYAAEMKDWSLSLSLQSARSVLPKVVDYFIQKHGDAFSNIAQILVAY